MRRKTANRAIALLLTVVMAVGLCGTSVFAAGGDPLASGVTGGSYTDPSVEAGKTYEYTIVDDITGETATVLATVDSSSVVKAYFLVKPGEITEGDYIILNSRFYRALVAEQSTVTGRTSQLDYVALFDYLGGSNAVGKNYSTDETAPERIDVGESWKDATFEWHIAGSNDTYTIKNTTTNNYLTFGAGTATTSGSPVNIGISSYSGTEAHANSVVLFCSNQYLNMHGGFDGYFGGYSDKNDGGAATYLYRAAYVLTDDAITNITGTVQSESYYTSDSWATYATALENAKNSYDTEGAALEALNKLQAARDALKVKPNMLFTVTTEADYNGGTVSSEDLTATATPNDGQRFCYWLKDGAYYSSEATITVTDTNSVYTAWFIAGTGDDSIRVPITWQRTDEQTTDSDGDGSIVVTGIDTYASNTTDWTQGNVSYGVEWVDIRELTVTSHPYVWDFEQTGTDGDGVGYQYGAYTNDNSYEKSVVAATWKDLDTKGDNDTGWKWGSARLFRGTFYWPEGYSTSDIVKMVSVNDANYQFIYDYINNSEDEELKAAYAGGSVIPINDDMFVFIHRVEDDLSKKESAEALRYLDFFTGTTGKGAWSYAGVSGNDWAKTEETLLGTQFSSRAFRWSWPNLTETNSEVVSFQNDTAHPDYKQALAHTDGWYTILNTSALSSKLSDVYGANTTFAAGQQFYFDIYCIDNDGSGGMDKWELTFKKSPQTVTVNYYYASVTDPTDDKHFLGSAQITGKVTGDQITLPGTTAAAGLNYLLDEARAKAGEGYTCTGGVQQGAVPYVVKAGENVINVLYVPVAKSGIQLVSVGAQYVYNGSEQSASGIKLYANGKEVTPTSANQWVVSGVTLTYKGTGSVSQTYVGNYPNTIQFENGKYTDLTVSNESGLTFVAPVIGTLTITPVTDFVIDYGLPMVITPSDMGFDPDGSTTFMLDNTSELQYGDAELSTDKGTLTYTPYKTVDDVESIPVSGLVGAGGYTYSGSINIIPATNVLYEESFASTSNEQAVKWTKEGTAAQLQQQTAYPGMTGANVYGYDDAYVADQENSAYSNGSAWKATVNEACQGLNYASNCPKAEFTFTGTGFDIYSECGADTGMLFVTVRNAETNAAVAGYMVDTLFNGTFYTAGDNGTVSVGGGMVYQIPVVHNADLTYGTYKVTVYGYYVNRNVDATPMSVSGADDAVTAESLAKELGLDDVGLQFVYMDKSSPLATLAAGGAIRRDSDDGAVTFAAGAEQIVYLDGFRVYNPLGTATLSVAAQNAYTGDSEINPTYVSLFKVLMEQSEQNQNVLVFVEKSGETYTLNNEYQIKSGPQNEIYLKPGQSVAFTATSSRVMVSAKTINGKTKMNAVTITSGTEQYFELTGTGNTYTITNNGDKILSLVNLKLIDGAMTTVGADTYTAIATALGAPVTLQDGTVVEPEKPEPVEPEWVNPYDDVHQQDWFYEYVKYVTQHGLMNGMGDRKFAPKTVMNRAMLATVLYRIAGEPEVSGEMPFSDVATGEWYSDAILWAVQNGVVEGVGGGKFAPDEPLTREQMVTMLYRYWKLSNPDAAAAGETGAQFIDWDLVSDWALEAMRWAVANGQIHGMTAETLSPQGNLPREQAATLLARYDRLVSGK